SSGTPTCSPTACARAGWRSERKIRRFVAERLLTPDGARSQALRGPKATAGLANKLVDALERERLIRSETRGGRTWVELAHDRLVPAIHLSNRTWSESQARRRRAWRFVFFMLMFAGLVVGLAYLGKLAYGKWQELNNEKAGLEQKLATLGEGEEALTKQLARAQGELAGEQRRAQLARLGEELRTLARDAQLLQTVIFEMGRYRPSPRDVDVEAETLINYVASGQELARVGLQVQALGASQQQLLADIKATATTHKIDELEQLFDDLGDATEELTSELERLQKSVTTMTTDFGRYSARLSANLDGWESPPRPGASLEERVRETSRGQWRAGFRAWLANDIPGARSRFQKAAERDPSNPAAHEALARLSWSEGQFAAAEKDFRAALAQGVEYGPALAGMSAVYLHEQALADADRCVRRALAVQPGFAAAHFILGEVKHRLAQPDVKAGKVSGDNPCKKRAAPAAPTDPAAAPADPAAAPADPAPAE
ncbi:MAG TPA: tetratricopeptide repeat protein, partial [Nannocystis sp.]